jgi:hypothetical protein
MSLGNQGVFQLLKDVTFRRVLVFYNSRKWGHFGAVHARLSVPDWLVGLVRELLTYLWSSQLIELMMNVSC